MTLKVLIVTTSADQAEDGATCTGFDWLSLTIPYWRLRQAGVRIGFASIRGGKPRGDPETARGEDGERAGAVDMFLGDGGAVNALAHSMPVDAVDPCDWDGVLLTDGRGGLVDFATSDPLVDLIGAVWARNRVIAAIGTGTTALLNVQVSGGRSLVSGLRLTCAPSRSANASPEPTTLEARFAAKGAEVWIAPDGEPAAVVEDGRLITGQDARAAAEVALQLLDALDVYAAGPAATQDTPSTVP